MRGLVICLVLLLAAVTGSVTDAEPASPAPSAACIENLADERFRGYTEQLKVTTTDSRELPDLEQVKACTDSTGTGLLLRNSGDAVWVMSMDATILQESLRASSFRGLDGRHRLLLPSTSLFVNAAPSTVMWHLDRRGSALWYAHEHATDVVEQQARQQMSDYLAGKSRRRQAFATCFQAGYEAHERAAKLADSDANEVMAAAYGVATDAAQCVLDFLKVEQHAASRNARTATTLDDSLTKLSVGVRWLDKVDDRLSLWRQVAKAVAVVGRG